MCMASQEDTAPSKINMLSFSMSEMKELQYLTLSSSIATRATDAQSEVRNLSLPLEKKKNEQH